MSHTFMSHTFISALSLSTLLLACAHDRAEQRAETATPTRAHAHAAQERRATADSAERVSLPEHHRSRGHMASAGGLVEASAGADSDAEEHDADNTGINERDRHGENPTPMDQGNGQIDLDLTQRIRKAVMQDDSLSFTAKNVKIITRDGEVVLRGPVKSQQERDAIYRAATREAGTGRVTNQLEVERD